MMVPNAASIFVAKGLSSAHSDFLFLIIKEAGRRQNKIIDREPATRRSYTKNPEEDAERMTQFG